MRRKREAKEIIAWINEKLVENQKDTRTTSFKDASASSRCVIDLIDGMKPGFKNYNMVSDGESDEKWGEKLAPNCTRCLKTW